MQDASPTQFQNAREDWPIYDTVQIRDGAKDNKEGYDTFQALAAIDEIPFFTVRKRDIGIAYTNRDSNESLEFAYMLKSVGVSFRPHLAPTPAGPKPEQGDAPGVHNPLSTAMFLHLIEHCGLILKIRADEKLTVTVPLVPDGTGNFGFVGATTVAGAQQIQAATSNGWPHNKNRFTFSGEGIQIPRGATFGAVLRFSNYAKSVLACLPNPGAMHFNADPFNVTPPADCLVKPCSLIRVSLNGWREVQQRNALHV